MTPVAGRQAVTTLRPRGAGAGERLRALASLALTGTVIKHPGFAALSACAVAVLLLLTRNAYFWRDEWHFVLGRSFTDPTTWLLPHAEHFVALHAAVYSALLAVFDTSTYLPFLAVTWLAHIAFVAAIYVLIERHVSRGPALATAAILLFLGSAAFNLYWAFQMGALASGALAMWGLVVIRERPGLAAVLMGLGVATTGFAFFMIPAAVLYGWSRRALLAAAVPVLVYATWYVLVGHAAIGQGETPAATTLPTLSDFLLWLVGGVAASAASLTGLGPVGIVALLVVALLFMRRPNRLGAVGIAALLTEYAILGLTRPGLSVPGGWQYVYFGASFVALIVASAWPAVPRWGKPVFVLFAAIALATNMAALIGWSSIWAEIRAIPDVQCTDCWVPGGL